MLLATLVGVTTVPYLARRVAAARVRDALDYEITRAGMIYAGMVIVIGVAALNTGNNLLYIIVAAMLAAIIVSGIASAMVLHSLQLDVRLPEHVFAGRDTFGKIVVRNPRRAGAVVFHQRGVFAEREGREALAARAYRLRVSAGASRKRAMAAHS